MLCAMPRKTQSSPLALQASLSLTAGGESLGGHGRMALLRAVGEQGSITQAAKAVGLSYKAAWDAIDQMNQRAGEPLVQRSAGGRGGGATRLTEHGRRLLARHAQIEQVHQGFVQRLEETALDLDEEFSLLKVLSMKTTARNQFLGRVSALRTGAVNDEIELTLDRGGTLVAIVTRESTEALGLRPQRTLLALVQASHVLLATGLAGARVSARNQLAGVVARVLPGAVNSEVTLALDGGAEIAAIVTQPSVEALGLVPGQPATALIKASDLILAVVD
jgi:molybdate transport system regulatory protein